MLWDNNILLIERGKCPPDTDRQAARGSLARQILTSRIADLYVAARVMFLQLRLAKPGGVSFVQPTKLERACLFLERYCLPENYALASCVEDHICYGL